MKKILTILIILITTNLAAQEKVEFSIKGHRAFAHITLGEGERLIASDFNLYLTIDTPGLEIIQDPVSGDIIHGDEYNYYEGDITLSGDITGLNGAASDSYQLILGYQIVDSEGNLMIPTEISRELSPGGNYLPLIGIGILAILFFIILYRLKKR